MNYHFKISYVSFRSQTQFESEKEKLANIKNNNNTKVTININRTTQINTVAAKIQSANQVQNYGVKELNYLLKYNL